MGAVLTVNETKTEMIRLVNGKLVKEEAQRNLYVVPPKNGEYEFTITGYSMPFEMRRLPQHMKPGMRETATKVRVEFTLANGKMIQCLFGFAIGETANLGKVLRRLNVSLAPDPKKGGWDIDSIIGYRGKGYFTLSDTIDETTGKPKYVNLEPGSVEFIAAPDQPYSYEEVITESIPVSNNSESNGNHAPADDGWE